MNGHQECLSLTSILQVVASFCQIFSAAAAMKVRRPGIRPIVEADLRWLARLAELAGRKSRN